MYGSPIWTLRAGLRAQLREDRRRGRHDERAAHAAREADPLARRSSAPAPRKISTASGKLTISMPTSLEEGVGVRLDLLEALGRDDLDRLQLAGQVRQRCPCAAPGARSGARPDRAGRRGVRGPGAVIASPRGAVRVSRDRAATMVRRGAASEPAGELPGLVEGEARAAGRDASPISWNGTPRRGQVVGQGRLGDRRLGDDERVRLERRDVAGQRGRGSWPRPRASRGRRPTVMDRPPASREALAERAVGGAVEEAAGHDGRGGHDRHVVARLGEVEWPSRDRASRSRSSRTRTRRPTTAGAVEHGLDRRDVRVVHAGEPVDAAAAPAGTRSAAVATRSPR